MRKVFVTGATGFLGLNLIQELLSQNYNVIGLDRNLKNYKEPDHERLQIIQGDALNIHPSLFSSCDVVFHLIGETTPNLPYAEYDRINVQTALNVVQAAIQNKVKKFIFVSTANTIGYADDCSMGSEEKPIRYPYNQSGYPLSKLNAEKELLKYADKIDILIANPTFMIGAYDYKPTSNRIVKGALDKKIVFYPPGGKNFVDVNDVAKGLISLIENGKNKEKYLFAGENLSFLEFYIKLSNQLGKKQKFVRIPEVVMKVLGWVGDFLLSIHIRTDLSTLNMRILSLDNFYSNDKSKKELKLNYRPIEDAIAKSISFFKNNG